MTQTNREVLESVLQEFADRFREERPIIQFRMDISPDDYAAAHASEDEAMDDIHSQANCESDR